jgi:hypothetical protein
MHVNGSTVHMDHRLWCSQVWGLLVIEVRVQLSVCQAQGAQPCTAKVLHVLLRDFLELGIQGVLVCQTLIDDSVSTLQAARQAQGGALSATIRSCILQPAIPHSCVV